MQRLKSRLTMGDGVGNSPKNHLDTLASIWENIRTFAGSGVANGSQKLTNKDMTAKTLQKIGLGLLLGSCSAGIAYAAVPDTSILPLKYQQRLITFVQDTNVFVQGFDRVSDISEGRRMIDDWICVDPRPVGAVKWWGSYLGEGPGEPKRPTTVLPPGLFNIEIWGSTANPPVPNPDPINPPRQPTLLLNTWSPEVLRTRVGVDDAGDYVYQYEAGIFFAQTFGSEYFISIYRTATDGPEGADQWGWHDSQIYSIAGNNFRAPAMSSLTGLPGSWTPFDGSSNPGFQPLDLSMELFVVPEPATIMTNALVLIGIGSGLYLRRRKAAK